jgi:single-strand DNA-binding protein
MAFSFTRVSIAGNLTRDIELKYTQSGMAVANLSVATNERRKVGDDYVDDPCYTECTAWGKTAEYASEYLSKGSFVVVDGRLKMDTWESNGEKKSRLGVVIDKLVSPKTGERPQQGGTQQPSGQQRSSSQPQQQRSQQRPAASGGSFDGYPSDEIPF